MKSLLARGRAASTIRTIISAIGTIHKLWHGTDPSKAFLVIRSLKGLEKFAKEKSHLLPINKTLLSKILKKLPNLNFSKYLVKALKAMFALAYEGCFRIGELIVSGEDKHTLTINNVQFLTSKTPHALKLTLDSFKHHAAPASILIQKRKSRESAYKLVRKYLKVRPTGEGHLFLDKDRSPFQRNLVASALRACLEGLVEDPAKYNTHSFRVGRTTDLVEEGTPESVIQQVGRWKSTAYRCYYRSQEFLMPY